MASEQQILYLSICVNLLRMLKSYSHKSILTFRPVKQKKPTQYMEGSQGFNYTFVKI